jgi:hypothetical protein
MVIVKINLWGWIAEKYGKMAIWEYGNMVMWYYGNTAMWEYGNKAIWQYGNMAMWQYGNMGIWQHGNMAMWQYGNMLHDLFSKFHVMYVLFQIGSKRQHFSTFLLLIRFRDMCV